VARTEAAAALTVAHHRAQAQIRAQALRDYVKLWPAWTPGDDHSFSALVAGAVTVVGSYHRMSGAAAVGYYGRFRAAEGIRGVATPKIAPVPPTEQITASLYVTGKVGYRDAKRRGQTDEGARRNTLVRTSGAIARHVLAGGRDSLLASVHADEQALGWARVTDGDPCYFCLTLAARGPVYKSEQTAGFEAHDHCDCTAEPFYRGSAWPGRAREYQQIYDAAQQFGLDEGLLLPGENSSKARLNAVRRYLATR
jgi:hypothetical protein